MSRPASRSRGARMVDVATLAGVSQQTVSRVVNNAVNVSPDIRERVERAIEQLRYRRNTAASALASSRTMNLGVVSFALSVHGPSVALYGISEEARRHGYSTRLVTLADIDRSSVRHAVDALTSDEVDGVIVLAPMTAAVEALRDLETDVPVITFEQGSPATESSVSLDEVLGARLAVRHLLELGHETVWHVRGPEGWMASDARRRGWALELSEWSRPAPPVVATTDWSVGAGYEAGRRLAAMPEVTAVFAANDSFALGVVKALDDAGVRVPEDVSVVGFDDVPETGYYRPPLTTIRLDFEEVGRVAVSSILSRMKGEAAATIPLIPLALVPRASTAPPSARPGRAS